MRRHNMISDISSVREKVWRIIFSHSQKKESGNFFFTVREMVKEAGKRKENSNRLIVNGILKIIFKINCKQIISFSNILGFRYLAHI